MADNTFEKGLEIRTAVLGAEYVDKAVADADSFTKPIQDLVTEYCCGGVGSRGTEPQDPQHADAAMIAVLNRPQELRTHIRAALTNGVSREEIREVFMQVAVYAGVPAAVDGFRVARDTFAELDRG